MDVFPRLMNKDGGFGTMLLPATSCLWIPSWAPLFCKELCSTEGSWTGSPGLSTSPLLAFDVPLRPLKVGPGKRG